MTTLESTDAQVTVADDGHPPSPMPGQSESTATCTKPPIPSSCAHCGLEVPKGLIRAEDSEQFCCHGCRTAYQLITACDLEDFYRLADRQQAVPDQTATDFEEFDTEFFIDQHTQPFSNDRQSSDQLRKVTFAIDGLHCSACIWLIEKLPQICPGVVEATVNWNSQSVVITYFMDTRLSRVARSLSDLGYAPAVFETDAQSERSRVENRKSLFNLGFAGAAAGNNMLVALALYLGQFYGMSIATERLLVFYSGLISLASVLGPGRKILSKAIWALKTRTPHMDLPVALGMTVGLVAGWINAWFGSSAVFFDSISVLVFVLLLGRYIQQLQQRAAIEKLSLVNRLLPRFCLRQENGVWKKVAIETIKAGDRIRVKRQETVPVDGQIIDGKSSFDLSILTGESFPVAARPSESVFAGTLNLERQVELEATQSAADSKIATIFQDVEKSIRKKTRIVQLADRIGARFVVAVLLIAMFTFLIWLPNWMFAANAAVAVLIVACPCALALATPVAISVALISALKKRILIKDGDVFEQLSDCRTIWFDKTGTLTKGQLQLTEWFGSEQIKRIVAAIEIKSGHPVAQAIVRSLLEELELSEDDLSLTEVSKVQQFSTGIAANACQQEYTIGARGLMDSESIEVGACFAEAEKRFLENGWSPVFVAAGTEVVAVLSIGDQIRECSGGVIAELSQGHQVGILSGDRKEIVDRVARRLGIDRKNCHAELSPQEKAELATAFGKSLMIGDGVNDASALAAATVGIAINDKLDLNSRIAPVVLRSDQLEKVPLLLQASKRVMRLIYRNIAISLLYNIVAVSLAIAGFIHPVIAAIFMPVSSLSILFASILSNPFGGKSES